MSLAKGAAHLDELTTDLNTSRMSSQLLWQEKVHHAQGRYLQATMRHIRMAAEVRLGQSEGSEGEYAVARARRAVAVALCALARTIQIYCDLVLRGIVPPDDDDAAPVW